MATTGNQTEHSIHPVLSHHAIAMWLVKYGFISVICLGTIGNFLSFIVLMRKRMRRTSINFYLACLACADTVVLYTSGFKTWLRVVTGFEMLHLSDVSCKTTTFLFMLALHVSAWLVVLVTCDRFIVVLFPFKAAVWCSQRRSRILVLSTVLGLTVYLLHLFWTVSLQHLEMVGNYTNYTRTVTMCAPSEDNYFMNGPFNYIKFASYSLIPFVCVLAMNVGIIQRICYNARNPVSEVRLTPAVYRASSSTAQLVGTGGRPDSSKQQVTVMLLLVSFSWLVLSTPFTLVSLLPFSLTGLESRHAAFLVKTCCFLLLYLNHSVNFLLYCIAGRRFRRELRHLVADICQRRCGTRGPGSRWRGTGRGTSTWSLRTRSKRTGQTPLDFRIEEVPLQKTGK